MAILSVSPEQRSALHQERYYYPDPRAQRKLEAIYLLTHELTLTQVAQITQLSEKTIQRYLEQYQAEGIAGLKQNKYVKPVSELDQHTDKIKLYFTENPPHSTKQAQAAIFELTGLQRSAAQIKAFFKRLGMKYLKCGMVPGKLTDEKKEQARYVDLQLQPRLTEATNGQRHVLFVDASHFLYGAFLGWLWCFARIILPSASGRKRYNILGAIHYQSKRVHTVCNTGYITSTTVVELLEQLAKNYVGTPLTIVLYNAAYQRCNLVRSVAERLKIELLFLPSYSPNLNLIERLWRFVKKKCVYGKHYANFTEFQEALDRCLAETSTRHRAALETLITNRFQLYPLESTAA